MAQCNGARTGPSAATTEAALIQVIGSSHAEMRDRLGVFCPRTTYLLYSARGTPVSNICHIISFQWHGNEHLKPRGSISLDAA
jgi:hypothetical protein